MKRSPILGSIVVTNQDTGVSGRGAVTGVNFDIFGGIEFTADNTQYNGSWLAMRDPGSWAHLSFWSPGPKDSGVYLATLESTDGKRITCEFGYNMTSNSGKGLCKSRGTGTMYDLFISLI